MEFMRLLLLAALALTAAAPTAQAPGRIATTPRALLASPVFFHGRVVAVRSGVAEHRSLARLALPPAADGEKPDTRAIFVLWKDGGADDEGEIRGDFWDLGRLSETDSRFSSYDFRPILESETNGLWPARDQVFVILNAVRVDSPAPVAPTLRGIVMDPARYASQTVTISGRFRGRNLFGDVPSPLNRSRWDFVLQSADAALWVSGLRPRGDGFELDPGLRVDTGRWVEVSGTVQSEGSRVWLEGKTIREATAPTETPVEIDVPPPPAAPPPEVIFSAPIAEEVDVPVGSAVRVQFSRGLDPRSLRDRIRVSYLPPAQGVAPAPPVFTFSYDEGRNALQIKFAAPLERFQRVKVELLEGITATDGQPLAPWTLTFGTGA
jgi:hypothetical protein